MKKILHSLLFPVLLVASLQINAAAPLGGEIYYRNIGGKKFIITANSYYDCRGIPGKPIIKISKASGGTALTLDLPNTENKDITEVCPTQQPLCSVNSDGIRLQVYADTIDLEEPQYSFLFSQSNCEVEVFFSECCGSARNNIPGDNIYVPTSFDVCKLQNSFSSSPIYRKNLPAHYSRVRPFYGHLSTFDADGDSIVFSLACPKKANNSCSNYLSGFSVNKPFPFFCYNGPYCTPPNPYINKPSGLYISQEGEIIFTPDPYVYGSYVLAFEITEYRKDTSGIWQKVSLVHKRTTFTCLSNSNNAAPTLSGTQNNFVCAGNSFCMTIQATDNFPTTNLIPRDSCVIEWETDIPGAVVSISDNTTKSPKLNFCWQPGSEYVREEPYKLYVSSYDNFCPKTLRTSKVYYFYVCQKPTANRIYEIDSCGIIRFTTDKKKQLSELSFEWKVYNNQKDIVYSYEASDSCLITQPGIYYVDCKVNNIVTGCFTWHTDTLDLSNIHPAPTVFFDTDTFYLCPTVPAVIKAKTINTNGNLYFNWTDNANNGIPNYDSLYFIAQNEGKINIELVDQAGCTNKAQTNVRLFEQPNIFVSNDTTVCFNSAITIKAWSNFNGNFIWQPGNFTGSDFQVTQSDNYVATLTDFNGCKAKDSVFVFAMPDLNPISDDTIGYCYDAPSFLLVANFYQWADKATYKWTEMLNLHTISNERHFQYYYPFNRKLALDITVTRQGTTCAASDTVQMVVYPQPKIDIYTQTLSQCLQANEFLTTNLLHQPTYNHYKWLFSDGSEFYTSNVVKTFATAGRHTVNLEIKDSKGCKNSDNATYTVFANPTIDTISGVGATKHNKIENYSVPFKQGSTYQWSVTNGNIISANGYNTIQVQWGNSLSSGLLFVTETDKNGCQSAETNKVVYLSTVSTNEIEKPLFEVYPNPAKNEFALFCPVAAEWELTDITGKTIKTGSANAGETTLVSIFGLKKGIYNLSIVANQFVVNIKLVVE